MAQSRSGGPDDQIRAWKHFARRAVDARAVWSVSSSDGPLGAKGLDGSEARPFWSSRRRVERMIETSSVPPRDVEVIRIPLDEFVKRSLLELAESHVLVGVDWGTDRRGWVFEAAVVRAALRRLIHVRMN
jgi:hypothetical protein